MFRCRYTNATQAYRYAQQKEDEMKTIIDLIISSLATISGYCDLFYASKAISNLAPGLEFMKAPFYNPYRYIYSESNFNIKVKAARAKVILFIYWFLLFGILGLANSYLMD